MKKSRKYHLKRMTARAQRHASKRAAGNHKYTTEAGLFDWLSYTPAPRPTFEELRKRAVKNDVGAVVHDTPISRKLGKQNWKPSNE